MGQWQSLDLNTSAELYSVQYQANGHVLVGGLDTVHVSLNDGIAFEKRATTYEQANIFGANLAVHGFDPLRILITGTMNLGAAETIFLTEDGGLSYEPVHHASVGLIDILYDLEFGQAPMGLACGTNGRILRSNNNGSTWSVVHGDAGLLVRTLAHAGGGVYLAGRGSGVMRSIDQGSTWSTVPDAPPAQWVGEADGVCYALGSSGQVWRSTDQGGTWSAMGQVPGEGIECMAVVSADTVLVATSAGLYRTHTHGLYWEEFVLPGYQTIRQMDLRNAQNVIAVGANGYAIRTGNGGGPAAPIAVLQAPSGTICPGDAVTFTSPNDPAYMYQWFVNGDLAGSGQELTTSFGEPGPQQVELVVHNGNAPDTAFAVVHVTAQVQVAQFDALPAADTLCANANTTISVPGSQWGTNYGLFRDGLQLGNWQNGNNGTLTFNSTGIQPGMVHVVRAARSNACGSDTLEVVVPIVVLTGSPGSVGILQVDSLCVPASTTALVTGTLPGFRYRYASATLGTGAYVQGSGGQAVLPLPTISTITPPTHTFTIEANYIGTSCVFALPGTFTVHVFSNALATDLADAVIMVDQPLDLVATAPDLDQFIWDFGPDASLPLYVGADPPPVSWPTPGPRAVTLTADLGVGICQAVRSALITVLDPIPLLPMSTCQAGSVSGDLYISDMHLDAFNNRYITGQYHGGVGEAQRDMFVMKVDSTGAIVWQRFVPVSSQPNTFGLGITADQQGNTYVTVESNSGNLNPIDGVMPVHPYWMLKFDLAGQVRWVMSSAQIRFRGLACTADNRVHVVGYGAWNGARVELPNGPVLTIPSAATDPSGGSFAVLTLEPSGELVGWNTFGRATHPDSTEHFAITADDGTLGAAAAYRTDPDLQTTPEGHLLISGILSSQRGLMQYIFDGVPLQDHAGVDTTLNRNQVFAARMVPGGSFIDGFTALGGDLQRVSRVSRAADGSYRIVGRIRNALVANGAITDLDMPQGGGNGPYHGFVASVNMNGQPSWYGTALGFLPFDAQVAPNGDLLVLATAEGIAQLPAMAQGVLGLPVVSGSDRLLISYSEQGVVLGADREVADGVEVGYRMVTDACGNLHVATVAGLTGAVSYTDAMVCAEPTGNVRFDVKEVTVCTDGCAPGYDPSLRDAALLAIRLSDDSTDPVGDRLLLVDVQCVGGETITDMVFAYRINGGAVQQYQWTGSLDHGQRILDLPIGASSLDDAHYHVIDVWVGTVNGTQDMDALNDSLSLEQLVCNAPLQGTYVLGPGAAFPSFKAAEMALGTCGIAGTTVFSVTDGDHYDQISLGAIPGAVPADTVLFRAQSGDSSSVHLWLRRRIYNGFNGISLDNNTAAIGFEDLSIHVRDTWGLNNSVVSLGFCDRIFLRGCLLEHVPGHLGRVIDASANLRQTRISVIGSTLRFAAVGINGLNSGNQVGRDSILVFRNNLFDRQRGEGIVWTIKTFGQEVEGNRFFTEAPYAGYGYKAMIVGETDSGPIRVVGNTVLRTSPNSGGPQLQVRAGNAFPGRSLIANNMVMLPQPVFGMALEYPAQGGPVDIVHNTLEGNIRIFGSTPNDVVIRNNLVRAHHAVMRLDVSGSMAALVSDHNVFWSDEDTLDGAWFTRSGVYHSLASWQNAFGLDLNSWVVEPAFIAPDDHHLDTDNYFFCPVFPGVEVDIDGDPRGPLFASQGADEGDGSVALPEMTRSPELTVWPNPNHGAFLLDGLQDDAQELHLHDALGALVRKYRITPGMGPLSLSMDLAPGSYLLRAIGRDARSVRSVVVIQERSFR